MECVKIKEWKSQMFKGWISRHQRFFLGRGMRYAKLQQNHCMDISGKSPFCVISSNRACLSTLLANLIYDKIEKKQVLRKETIKQEFCKTRENATTNRIR